MFTLDQKKKEVGVCVTKKQRGRDLSLFLNLTTPLQTIHLRWLPASAGDSPPCPYGSSPLPSPTPPQLQPHGRCAAPNPFHQWGNPRLPQSGTGGIGDGDGSCQGNPYSHRIWSLIKRKPPVSDPMIKEAGDTSSSRLDPRSGDSSDLIMSASLRQFVTTPIVTLAISTTAAVNSEADQIDHLQGKISNE
ncbi:unnamed protein product [Lactuca virosa]|uniref:Uncharacterized protein n=1 Tax=Lactuca virosa TaxID=75947 RepID=A0AAU9MBP5_9ASTR|nr:unnamed protein product [Lactuca virosa]